MSDISRLVVAWVSAQQRHFHNSTRGIATVEQRLEWEREAEEIIAAHDAEVLARVEQSDERIIAWEAVAAHDAIKPCYDEERPLLPAMLDRLSDLAELEKSITELEPSRVQPSREDVFRVVGEALVDSWSDMEEYAEAPTAITDALLALWPGEPAADAERRGAVRALRDAAGSPIPRGALATGTRAWLRDRADQIEEGSNDK